MKNYFCEHVVNQRNPFNKDYRIVRKSDGAVRWVYGLGELETDDNGNVISMIGTIQDITERKHAEQESRESEERFRMVFENVFDGIAIYEENDDPFKRRLIECNNQYAIMAGRSREELLSMGFVHHLQVSLDKSNNHTRLESLARQIAYKGSSTWIRPDGKENVIEYIGVPITWRGKSYSIGIDRDVTERMQIEADLIAAKEKAEESDRLKSSFLANMSHEIRTPLNSIIGFSELMSDTDFDHDQQHQFAQIIHASGNNLLSIITDIMDISKIEAGLVEVRKNELSVSYLIKSIHRQYSFQAKEKGIELMLDPCIPSEEIILRTDETKLRQIIVNLVGNSIKFTEKGFVELGMRKTQDALQIHVKDTGIGISPEHRDKIFERFRQVESCYSRRYGGNGLGLSISKSLVELMGGKLWMESEEGKGSTFYFTLPLDEDKSICS
ncbi:MAG TPA: ATP-binding protein, partial [Prolixibacteraceae bacterium]|nr:ATP-binding protein [Prolixibacteraceae bacterium]